VDTLKFTLHLKKLKKQMKHLLLALSLIAVATITRAQELKLPALSPHAKIVQDFSTSSIEINYSRPSMRGRKIFGDLVQYGNVWRTGANSATKIKIGEDMTIGGQSVKAGEYALYTIPGQSEWEIIFNKATGNWGVDGYDKAEDVARFRITPKTSDKNTHTFTISIDNITYSTCDIVLSWEKTKVVIPVKSNNEERLETSIDKAINHATVPYFQAASYYFENNKHLDKAYTYVGKAIEDNPKAYYIWLLKARIAQKLGKREDALEAANKSIELAKGSAYEAEYKHNNQKIIDALK
jgi:hypothetical protein